MNNHPLSDSINNQTRINDLITLNEWGTLANFLKKEKGIIGCLGGHYIFHKYQNDCADLDKICREVWYASFTDEFKKRTQDPFVASRVIEVYRELKRLYLETNDALGRASLHARIATKVYDLLERYSDGYSPIDRLQDNLIGHMKAILKTSGHSVNKKDKRSVDSHEDLINSLKDHDEAVAYLKAALNKSFNGDEKSQKVLLDAVRNVAKAQGSDGLGEVLLQSCP